MIHDNKWTNTVTNDTSETVHVAAFNNSDHIPEWLVTAVRVFPKIGGVLAWAFGVLNGALKGTKHTAVLEPGMLFSLIDLPGQQLSSCVSKPSRYQKSQFSSQCRTFTTAM